MLGSVKAEAVNARVDTFLKERKHPLLHIGIGRIQIRQIPVSVILGLRAGTGRVSVVMERQADTVDVLVPVVIEHRLILSHGRRNCRGPVFFLALVIGGRHMVDYDIRKNADAVFLRLTAQERELLRTAERGIVADTETERLIESPPGGSAALWLLHGHGQNILETSVRDILQIDHDLMIRPVERMQRQPVLGIFRQAVGIMILKILKNRNPAAAYGIQAKQQHQQQ